MKLLYVFILGVLLVSCDKTTPKLSNFTISDRNSAEGIKVMDGVIYFASEKAGTISKDFQVKDINGNTVATYEKNMIVFAKNTGLNVPIKPDGEIDLDGARVYWDKEGRLWKDEVMSEYKLTPVNPDSNLAASIAFYLYFNYSAPSDEM